MAALLFGGALGFGATGFGAGGFGGAGFGGSGAASPLMRNTSPHFGQRTIASG